MAGLGILDGTVRAAVKPLRMLSDVGMIGGAVDRKVEGDLHADFARFFKKPGEIVEGAELRFDGAVSTFLGANCPGRADVTR